jgi:3-oxoacyl-[acyl-carrier protein] reductase
MNSRLLDGQCALVTGGSGVIGSAICRRLAENGAAVAVACKKNSAGAEAVAKEILAAGGRAVVVQGDLTDEGQVRALVAEAAKALGKIDVLVNDAWPGWRGGNIEDTPWQDYQWYLDQMVQAAYHTIRAVLPGMKERRWGRIVNLGTTAAYELNERHLPYITGKGALLALTRGVARDYGAYNILVNMVSPGQVWRDKGPQDPGFAPPHTKRAALGRVVTPWEVAGAVVFFVSPLSDGITGVQLPVCAGMMMHIG